MSGPVDVLAVMEKAAKELRHWQRDHGEDIRTKEALAWLREARAAVAELIEALREIADVTTPGDGVPNEVWINERANKALANIGETK